MHQIVLKRYPRPVITGRGQKSRHPSGARKDEGGYRPKLVRFAGYGYLLPDLFLTFGQKDGVVIDQIKRFAARYALILLLYRILTNGKNAI